MKDKHKQMYMRIAEAVALTSPAIRLKVGAVAVKNNMVIGTGYNAQPSGIDEPCEEKHYSSHRKLKPNDEYPLVDSDGHRHYLTTKPTVRHSEKNLLLNLAKSTESSQGAVLFCTHSCCKFCAMDIVDAGITKVYYRYDYRNLEGITYLRDNGVEVEQLLTPE